MLKTNADTVRVLLVGPIPLPFGGIATYVKDLYESQIDGVEFLLFNTAFPAWVAPIDRYGSLSRDSLVKNGLFTTLKIVLYVLLSYPYLAYRVIRDKPDIVHVFPSSHWSYWRNWFYVLLAKLLGRGIVFHLLNAIDLFYGRVGTLQKWFLRRSFRSGDVYLVQSKGLQTWLEQYCRKPCHGFLNGIHLDCVPSECSVPFNLPEIPKPIGLTIGALGKHKGTPQILEVLSQLRHKGIDIGWVFIGIGDLVAYKQRATELEIADRVIFTGPIDNHEKWQYLAHSDFYCLPSDAEGQPISILEAMAVGLPVIATSVGSIPEVIADGETGYIIPVGDNEALELALLKMLPDESRKAMGLAARQYLLQNHDIQQLFEHLGTVYRGIKRKGSWLGSFMRSSRSFEKPL